MDRDELNQPSWSLFRSWYIHVILGSRCLIRSNVFHRFTPAAPQDYFLFTPLPQSKRVRICTIEHFKYVMERKEGREEWEEYSDSSYSKDSWGTGFSEITPCSFFNSLLTRFRQLPPPWHRYHYIMSHIDSIDLMP